jgi:hypothetical protein
MIAKDRLESLGKVPDAVMAQETEYEPSGFFLGNEPSINSEEEYAGKYKLLPSRTFGSPQGNNGTAGADCRTFRGPSPDNAKRPSPCPSSLFIDFLWLPACRCLMRCRH